jgi:hypothetical protein
MWQISTKRKQLIVLLVVAAWTSLMFWDASNRPDNPYHPLGEFALRAGLDSLPVILFGGVLFWWFGTKKV